MQTFTLQYSIPRGNAVAVSDWTEYTTTIKATSNREAIAKFTKNREGTWHVLDCYPAFS